MDLKGSSFGTVHGSGISEMAQGMSGPNGQRSSQFSEAFFKVRCFLLMAKERRKEIVVFFDHKTPLVHFFVVTWSRRSILPEVSLKVKEVCQFARISTDIHRTAPKRESRKIPPIKFAMF